MTRWAVLERQIRARIAAEVAAEMDAVRERWRVCPATLSLHVSRHLTCTACMERTCAKQAALGLDDSGNALPFTERPSCGASTRAGGLCRKKVVPGRRRCRLHGGASTGPRTPEGKARIAAAQQRRWRMWREARGVGDTSGRSGAPAGPRERSPPGRRRDRPSDD